MGGATHEVNMENFEATVDTNPMVILSFWADWCQTCKLFKPVFEKTAQDHADVFFGTVNTVTAVDLAEAFRVRGVPTIMAFKQAELVFEYSGMLSPAMLEDLIGKLRSLEVTASQEPPKEP